MRILRIVRILLFIVGNVLFPQLLIGQNQPILLNNPSFEDIPNHSRPPAGWYFCGPIGESPPDVHPNGFFNVEHEAHNGNTYVGMVTRDNGSNECIGQQLENPMVIGACYQFSLRLAHSATYRSISRSTMDFAMFTTPVVLQVWGGHRNCQKASLLARSKAIRHEQWEQYTFYLQPQEAFTHLFLEAYFETEGSAASNGNLLLDHAGPILPVRCSDHALLSEIPTVDLVAPASPKELENLIAENGSKIKFTQSGLQLEQHLFRDGEGHFQQSNRYLWRIAKVLQYFPQTKLMIAVTGNSELELTERKFYLTTLLQSAGLSSRQFKLKTLRNAKGDKGWIWPLSKESEIGMKIK